MRWICLLCPVVALQAQSTYATPYQFTTLAGYAATGSSDGAASASQFNHPTAVAADIFGNTFVADKSNHTIRKIAATGVVSTFAGTAGSSGSADGQGGAARFNAPYGVAVDINGNVYVADTSNHVIRKISVAGTVSTLAGTAGLSGSTDGQGGSARFYMPIAVALDNFGNVYVADFGNSTIRKITATGMTTTMAGSASNPGSVDGTGSAARFNAPYGLAATAAGEIYVADTYNHTIRKITAAGVVTTVAGTAGTSGTTDGSAAVALFSYPTGVAVDAAGIVYVADFSNAAIRKIASGVVSTVAGVAGASFYSGPDGIGASVRFNAPIGLAIDSSGNVMVAEYNRNTIRRVTPSGAVTTLAGTLPGSTDGTGSAARFFGPYDVAADGTGTVYVADTFNHVIRKITAAGLTTTLAGLVGSPGSIDGTGTGARLNFPTGVALDRAGNLYVAEFGNSTIRKITPVGAVTTVAGLAGVTGSIDGVAGGARFNSPYGLTVDGAGNIFVADTYNNTIRKIASGGVVTTLAGSAGASGSTDGAGAGARFNNPFDVVADSDGNVYVADSGNDTIRKITTAGVVTTLAGSAGNAGATDGTGSAARFDNPFGVAVDGSGLLYVSDNGNQTIRLVTAGGVVTTLAGAPGFRGSTDGVGGVVRFAAATGVAVDVSGVVYVADTDNQAIRRGMIRSSAPVITLEPVSQTVLIGAAVTFTAGASGTPAPNLQWKKDGVNLPGATSATYSIARAHLGDTGGYALVATNASGSATSQAATLTVRPSEAADFNTDGAPDLIWSNSLTGERALWLMYGTNFLGASTLGIFPLEWTIAATGDFNGDGKPDLVWSNGLTGERALWLMDGTNLLAVSTLGVFPLEWTVAATGDFNGDGKPDLVWSNSVTGERALWLMEGTIRIDVSTLGIFPLEWTVAATGDFNGDGKPDLVWSNSITGERALWLMDGTTRIGVSTLGLFPLEWTVAGTADFNSDGKPDIIWSNSVTGERALWLMDGTQFIAASTLGIFPLEWTVKN